MSVCEIDDLNDEWVVHKLCHGDCYPTAIVLHEALGWPIGGFLVDWKERSWLPHLAHAYVIAPDGRAFDASGFRSMDAIHARFMNSREGSESRNPRYVEYGDIDSFRRALRPLYMGAAPDESHPFHDPDFDPEERTRYDDELDDMIPSIRYAAIGRLDLAGKAKEQFPDLVLAA